MKKILARIKALASRWLTALLKLWAKEPARIVSVAAAAIVFVCARCGVVVPVQSVADALAFVLPLLLGGELIRTQVGPKA